MSYEELVDRLIEGKAIELRDLLSIDLERLCDDLPNAVVMDCN